MQRDAVTELANLTVDVAAAPTVIDPITTISKEAIATGDAKLTAQYRRDLENKIKGCAKDISTKYINPPHTLDFAILFIPTESLYAEVLRQPGLFEQLQRDYRVMIAGPTNLAALLTSFQLGFRSLALQKRSSEVWQLLGAIKTEFDRYGNVVNTLSRQLTTASNSVESLGRRTRAMSRKLKGVETLPDDKLQKVFSAFQSKNSSMAARKVERWRKSPRLLE